MFGLSNTSAPRDYLLMPCMPTSNGRMHLGHISGPYLKLDIIARHLRRRGDRVVHLFGSDPHDSFVGWKAYQTGRTEEDVTNGYHDEIVRDLLAMDIQCDQFINPLDAQWSHLYTRVLGDTTRHIIANGRTLVVPEKMLYCDATQRFIIGPWLLGKCPNCGTDAGSYFCETCGFCFRPETLREPRPRVNEGPLRWREVRCLNLQLSDKDRFFSAMRNAHVPEEFLVLIDTYVRTQGLRIRLSQPGTWGIPLDVPGETAPQVLFSYFGLWAYALALGELYADMTGAACHPFSHESKVITVWSFGIDNAVPLISCGTGAALEHGGYKPFDHLLLNHFYNLHGEKFSTSRGHAIWAGDIANETMADSDTLRYFLSFFSPEHTPRNFDLGEFVDLVNRKIAGEWNAATLECWTRLAPEPEQRRTEPVLNELDLLLKRQEQNLEPGQLETSLAAATIDTWFDRRKHLVPNSDASGASAWWWLNGLSLLAYPFMPRFGRALWQALGHSGAPVTSGLFERTRPSSSPDFLFRSLDSQRLSSCLPATLRTHANASRSD